MHAASTVEFYFVLELELVNCCRRTEDYSFNTLKSPQLPACSKHAHVFKGPAVALLLGSVLETWKDQIKIGNAVNKKRIIKNSMGNEEQSANCCMSYLLLLSCQKKYNIYDYGTRSVLYIVDNFGIFFRFFFPLFEIAMFSLKLLQRTRSDGNSSSQQPIN